MRPDVLSFQHPDPGALNEALCRSIYEHKLVDKGRKMNNSLGGWHSTTQDMAGRPGFPELIEFIRSEVRVPVGAHMIWTIVNPTGVGNARHPHGPGVLAACYYPRVPDPAPAIIFHDGGREYRMEPREGMLLIFDGSIEHSVEANKSDSDRIVVAMDFELL